MHHSLLVKSCLLLDSTNSWWIDFEATDHVCNSLQGFQVRRRLNDGDMYLTLASEARVSVQTMGDVTLIFYDNSFLVLKNCLYVLEFRKNFILVSSLYKLNYSFIFNNKQVFIKLNNFFICSRSLIDSLYLVIPLFVLPSNENDHI